MFRCLAVTDLCVGLISHPVFAAKLLFQINELRNLCYYFGVCGDIVNIVFSGVSLLTATAISVDRLLALSLGLRYRQVATVRRVGAILSCFWIVSVAVSLIDGFWGFTIASRVMTPIIILCLITSVYCYTKIFLRLRHHQVQMQADHAQQLATERRRNSTEHSKIPKDCFCSTMDPNNISRLLSSASFISKFVICFLSKQGISYY